MFCTSLFVKKRKKTHANDESAPHHCASLQMCVKENKEMRKRYKNLPLCLKRENCLFLRNLILHMNKWRDQRSEQPLAENETYEAFTITLMNETLIIPRDSSDDEERIHKNESIACVLFRCRKETRTKHIPFWGVRMTTIGSRVIIRTLLRRRWSDRRTTHDRRLLSNSLQRNGITHTHTHTYKHKHTHTRTTTREERWIDEFHQQATTNSHVISIV